MTEPTVTPKGEHLRFEERILAKFADPNGYNLVEWIESIANHHAQFGLEGGRINFNQNYYSSFDARKRELSYSEIIAEYAHSWTGSVKLSDKGSQVSVLSTYANENQRAIEAHELAHVAIFRNQALRRIIEGSKLVRDPDIERLADDLARALILPKVILNLNQALPVEQVFKDVKALSRRSIAPIRICITRIGTLLLRQPAIITFIATSVDGTATATTKWCISITPRINERGEKTYSFTDVISKDGAYAKVTKGIYSPNTVEEIPASELQRIVSRKAFSSIESFKNHLFIPVTIGKKQSEYLIISR